MNVTKLSWMLIISTLATGAVSLLCTRSTNTVTDADGTVYTTVKIGDQVWTVENLMTTKFNDGTPIPLVTDRSEWITAGDSARPAFCWYENDTNNRAKYGALYNWFAVSSGKLAPKGWHVPTDSDWTKLEDYLAEKGYNWDTTKAGQTIAKAMAAKTDWASNNGPGAVGNDISKNNQSGFSALPGGFRIDRGDFYDSGLHGYWWSATEYDTTLVWRRALYYDKSTRIRSYGTLKKGSGFSVRLVKD
jgi:uncharacterized protein (TIGR02145 family)